MSQWTDTDAGLESQTPKREDSAWTEGERAAIRRVLRYAVTIFAAIVVTLIVVGVAARLLSL